MSVLRTCVFSSAGFFATLLAAGTSLADEAYVCDGGRLVYVKLGELEHLKRTDPCIAGYYGLEIGKGTAAEKQVADKPGSDGVRNEVPEGGAEKGLALEREALAQSKAVVAAIPAVASAKPKKAVIAAPADFRNVLIINATPGTESIFRHER